MSEKELKEFKKALKQQKKAVQTSKEAAQKMLENIGVLTPKGNYTKAYKSLK